MIGVEARRVDRRLQVVAEDDVTQEDVQRPLVLLIAAGRSEREVREAVAERERGRERRPRPLAGRERGRQAVLEPEHLRARAERPAELGITGELCSHPARRRRDEIAEAVGDVEMHRVPGAHGAGRLAGAETLRSRDERRQPAAAGPELGRRVVVHEPAALVVVLGRQEPRERDVDEGRVAVEGLTVGEGELRALRDHVDVLGVREFREVESLEQRELLQEDRPCPHGGVLQTVSPWKSYVAGGSRLAHQDARSSPVRSPPFAAEKWSIASATNPS